MTADDALLGSLLRRHRSAAGLTQEELAERAAISARTVSDVERGLRSTIYRGTAERLAAALALDGAARAEFEAAARGRPSPARPEEAWMAVAARSVAAAAIPPQPTRLIGRERELDAVLASLRDPEVRLLTLTGPGGIGKTRLAASAASRAQGDFHDGVFFVPLAASRDPGLVPSTVAHALGVPTVNEPPIDALADRLRDRRSLLVLDNFEHLMEAAPAVGDLLGAAPGLTVLVTSREALHLRGEHELPLPTLDLPDEASGGPASDLGRSPATALFLERARAARPDLAIDEDAARVVAEICGALNGLPLAIELAAVRVKHLPLRALRDQLGRRLHVLTGGPRDVPERQRTMRDTVAWSYDLLEPAERSVFRSLSVFAGGWTLEAGQAVCARGDESDLLAEMSALVDKSLVAPDEDADGEPRFGMLHVIREFAAERCDAHGETGAALRRHAEHFLALAEAAEPELGRSSQETWFRRLEVEHDNLRAALRWAIDDRAAGVALRLAGAIWQFWRTLGYHDEGRAWLREALAVDPSREVRARAKALWGAAWLAYHQGDYEDAGLLGDELLALVGTGGDPIDRRNALTVLGMVALAEGRAGEALAPFEECVEICRRMGASARWLLGTSLLNLGSATTHAGDPAAGARSLEEAHEIYRELGDQHFAARIDAQLAYAALLGEERGRARARFQASLRAFRDLGDRDGVAEGLEGLSAVEAADGSAERAARIAGAAEALRQEQTTSPMPFDRATAEGYLAEARASLDADAWRAAWDEGRTMALDDAVATALGESSPSS